jgi:hypothetical protein
MKFMRLTQHKERWMGDTDLLLDVRAVAAESELKQAREHLDEFGSLPTIAEGIDKMRLALISLRAERDAMKAALEGLKYKEDDSYCDHAAEPCDRCDAVRKALALSSWVEKR